jgi:hypothetical protein
LFPNFNKIFIASLSFMNMLNKKKRGMSEVMTALLLILLVITTIAAVFIWNKQIFSSLTSGSKGCSEISLSIADFCYNPQTIMGQPKLGLTFNVRNELETKPIAGFLVFIDDGYGNTQTISNLADSNIAGFETKKLTTDFFPDSGKTSSATITPQQEINNKIVSCTDKQTTIKWSTIKPC